MIFLVPVPYRITALAGEAKVLDELGECLALRELSSLSLVWEAGHYLCSTPNPRPASRIGMLASVGT